MGLKREIFGRDSYMRQRFSFDVILDEAIRLIDFIRRIRYSQEISMWREIGVGLSAGHEYPLYGSSLIGLIPQGMLEGLVDIVTAILTRPSSMP